MMTKRQLGWQKLLLILTVLPCCRSLEVAVLQNAYEVARGGEISLACSFTPAKPITHTFILSWEAYPETPDGTMQTVATFFISNQVDIAPPYEGRASLEVDMNSRIGTLRLMKVTMKDSRRYQCSVIIPGDDEGTTAASTSLLVLVPPSVPVCKIQGKAEYWQNITLTCVSEEGSPKPTSRWESYSTENIKRGFPPKTTEKDGVLSLFNISRETSGFYICTSENDIGTASCNLTLAVVPASMNIGSTPIIIGVVVACVAVLGIIGFFCCWKRSKKNKKAKGAPGEVVFDRDAPEAEEEYRDVKPDKDSETKQLKQHEEKDIVPQKNYNVGAAAYYDDDQHSHYSGKDRYDGKGSDIGSQRYQHDQLDDQRGRSSGSRDRLDDQRDHYSGSRDRLDDNRDRYGGSRDRLDDSRNRYGGSRDRLDDNRDRYGGSRDRLDDNRDRHGGSRDRLDDYRDRYGGSRDRLDDHSDRYRNLDHSDRRVGSRDRLDYIDDPQRNGYD
ncbi:immunoglobulin superfamily member 11-like [Chaetodon auriga]|uniref:immunoglobulin superfamily member 11-like n=1 Tax=Chaetodon auriga TaxID=39042 RepID=UPI004032D4C3